MREREFDDQRKSNEAKDEEISNSLQFLEYKRKKEKEVEVRLTHVPDAVETILALFPEQGEFIEKLTSGYAMSETPYGPVWARGTRPYGTLSSASSSARLAGLG